MSITNTRVSASHMFTAISERLLSIEWNSIRLGDPVHGIVTKTVHKTLPGGGGGPGGRWVGGVGVVGVQGVGV